MVGDSGSPYVNTDGMVYKFEVFENHNLDTLCLNGSIITEFIIVLVKYWDEVDTT